MTKQVIAFRHAPVLAPGLCYGRYEVSVSLSATSAAAVIIAALPQLRPDRVWSSSSARCLEPARHLAGVLGVPLTVDARLAEIGLGTWEGRQWDEIATTDGAALEQWMEGWETVRPPGGETLIELESRVRGWYDALEVLRHHLLIGHAGVVRGIRVITGRCDWRQAMAQAVEPLVPERFGEGRNAVR